MVKGPDSIAIVGRQMMSVTCGCLSNTEITYLALDAYAWNGRHPDVHPMVRKFGGSQSDRISTDCNSPLVAR